MISNSWLQWELSWSNRLQGFDEITTYRGVNEAPSAYKNILNLGNGHGTKMFLIRKIYFQHHNAYWNSISMRSLYAVMRVNAQRTAAWVIT